MPRGRTVRAELEAALRASPATAHQLSRSVRVPEKEVASHLSHLARSLQAHGERLEVAPAACLGCGFEFKGRERLEKPGRCPRCRGTRIEPPVFSISSA